MQRYARELLADGTGAVPRPQADHLAELPLDVTRILIAGQRQVLRPGRWDRLDRTAGRLQGRLSIGRNERPGRVNLPPSLWICMGGEDRSTAEGG